MSKPLLRILLFVALLFTVILNEKAYVNAQTTNQEALINRVIEVTKGLNQDALRVFSDDINSTSYQSEAFLRLSQQVGVDGFTDAQIAQYYTLYCVFYATNGVSNPITNNDARFQNITMPEWLRTTNWKHKTNIGPCGIATLMNGTKETSIRTTFTATNNNGWFGVMCNAEGQVVALELFDNILTGTWPQEIVLLASDGPFSTGAGNLEILDLYGNEFLSNGGDSSWMSDLGSNMTTIIVEATGFSGDIPLLSDNLINFNIKNAYYTGGLIDDNFVFSSQLNYLNLDGNILNASIPSALSQLPDLEYVYMSDNFLIGDLSPLQGSPVIKEFWADGNPGLTGPLFSWLGNMTTLASLSLAYNNLTGSIPTEFGNLLEMKQMWLQYNSLVGSVPTELGKLAKLRHLELEENAFTGFVLPPICEKTESPFATLQTLGADCFDNNFFCPCCSCCNITECVAGVNRLQPTQ